MRSSRGDECARRFFRIGRPNDIDLRHDPHAAHRLDRLMRRAVFAHPDRVVGENVNVRQSRERGEPDRSAAIIGEDEKRRARSAEKAVISRRRS